MNAVKFNISFYKIHILSGLIVRLWWV